MRVKQTTPGALGALLLAAAPVWAADAPDDAIEPDQPGIVESSSTVGKGKVLIETGLGYQRDKNLALVEDLCTTMTDGSLCALGGLTPFSVLSALKNFPEDFNRDARIRIAADKACGGESLIARTGAHFTDCKRAAIDGALADLKAPLVAQALDRAVSPALAAR